MASHKRSSSRAQTSRTRSSTKRASSRSRVNFTAQQNRELERRFRQHNYLSLENRRALADEIGVPEDHIRTWFQNRRRRQKRQQLAEEAERLQSSVQGAAQASAVNDAEMFAQTGFLRPTAARGDAHFAELQSWNQASVLPAPTGQLMQDSDAMRWIDEIVQVPAEGIENTESGSTDSVQLTDMGTTTTYPMASQPALGAGPTSISYNNHAAQPKTETPTYSYRTLLSPTLSGVGSRVPAWVAERLDRMHLVSCLTSLPLRDVEELLLAADRSPNVVAAAHYADYRYRVASDLLQLRSDTLVFLAQRVSSATSPVTAGLT